MSIRATLVAVYGVAMAAVLLAGGTLYVGATRAHEAHHHTRWSAEALMLHIQLLADAGRYMKEAYGVYADPVGDAEELGAYRRRVEHGLAAIEELQRAAAKAEDGDEWLGGDEVPTRLERLRKRFAELTDGVDALRASHSASGVGAVEPYLVGIERLSEEVYDRRLVPEITAAIGREREEMRDHFVDEERVTERAQRVGVAAVTGSLLLLLILVRSLLRRIDRGVQTLVAGAERLASGALDTRVPAIGSDELGRLAAAFNRMAASLSEAQASRIRSERMAALGQLAASVGHDLRNPLGAVRNAFHYVERRLSGTELGSDERIRQVLAVVDREIAACGRIIGSLLDFARERRPTSLSSCALRPLVAEAVEVAQPPRPTRIENEVPARLAEVPADRDQLRQALVNLIQNAAEAIPADREGVVRITAAAEEHAIELRISDNGEGIPEVQQARIFEPLVSTKRKGTGLGLAVVASVVARHGGTVSVESEPGVGTTFIIRLPRRPEGAASGSGG